MSLRDRAYDAYLTLADGIGLDAKATSTAQALAHAAGEHHPIVGAATASVAIAAMIGRRFVTVTDPDVRYATFDIERR